MDLSIRPALIRLFCQPPTPSFPRPFKGANERASSTGRTNGNQGASEIERENVKR